MAVLLLGGLAACTTVEDAPRGEQAYAIMPPPPAVGLDYRIAPDDVLRIQVYHEPDLSLEDARVDAQSDWLQPVFSALTSLQYVALALVLLLAVTSAAAVFLAARSALGNNRATIEIVHLLGGTDGQIAQLFQRAVLVDSILGGAAGLVLGLAAVLALGYQFAALDSGMIASAGLDWIDWIVIALIPVFGVLLAVATARFTVLAAVRKML